VQFSTFVRALKMTSRLTLRRPQHGDPEEVILTEAFLCAEDLLHEQGTSDPRIPYLFAELLICLDDYDYALDCLKNLEARFVMPSSTDVALAISKAQQLRTSRVDQSRQGVNL